MYFYMKSENNSSAQQSWKPCYRRRTCVLSGPGLPYSVTSGGLQGGSMPHVRIHPYAGKGRCLGCPCPAV